MDSVGIKRKNDEKILLHQARWCASFWCKLRGLTFRRKLTARDTLILVENRDGRSATTIHMFFVFFPIAAIWIDSAGTVVDCRLARPFRPIYVPSAPARYVLEGPVGLLEELRPGDRVEFVPASP